MTAPTARAEGTGPLISIIVVAWNGDGVLPPCLASLQDHLRHVSYEAILVDNGSTDGTADMVECKFPSVRVIRNDLNVGFGQGNNIGMRAARGDFFLLLNSDARLVDDTPVRLVERLRARPGVGVAGPRLRFADGRLQASAHRFGSLGRLALEELGLYRLLPKARSADALLGPHWAHDTEREVDWVTGACMLVRREVFEQTGGFDPNMFLYGEEVEWCRRIRQRGWSVLFSPVGDVVHLGHESADRLLGERGRVDRCLIAGDRLLATQAGSMAARLAPWIRMIGALGRLTTFSLGGQLFRSRQYGHDVRRAAGLVVQHYVRRFLGRVKV